MKHIKKFGETGKKLPGRYKKLLNSNIDHINSRMEELDGVISENHDDLVVFSWSVDEKSENDTKSQGQLNIDFTHKNIVTRFEFDLDELKLEKLLDDELDFSEIVDSIDEGLDIIQNEIYHYLGVLPVNKNIINESTTWLPPSMVRDLDQLSQRSDGGNHVVDSFIIFLLTGKTPK